MMIISPKDALFLKYNIKEPGLQIPNNAGHEGCIVLNDEWVNMMEAGIVGPTKVTRYVLQNATSVAAMFLTTEAVVADIPEPASPMGVMPDGGNGWNDVRR